MKTLGTYKLSQKQKELPVPVASYLTTFRRRRFEARQATELEDVSIRGKLKGFWSNCSLAKEQVEQELRDFPEALKYWEAPPSARLRIDGSCAKEWKKCLDVHAAIPINGRELQELLDERLKPDYDPEFKSRLVSCGNFEDSTEVRTDARTSDSETHPLVAVFAASHGVPVESSDFRNAYFQAEPIDRVVRMRQPSGGLPDEDPESMLLLGVPVYGLCDSGLSGQQDIPKVLLLRRACKSSARSHHSRG